MRTNVLLITSMAAIGMMASCANDGAVQTKKAEPATIAIALNGTSTTRTAADVTNDGQINRIAVGLFDADNNLVSITEPTFTVSSGTLSATVTGTTLVTKVAAVANAPAGAFSSVKKLDDFHKVAIDISNTTTSDGKTADGSKQYESDLPMEGDGTVTNASTGTGSATFSLIRLASKIELDNIHVAFDATGAYSGYTFIPTEIFMSNVAETVYSNENSPYITAPAYLQGWSGATSPVTYLSTGALNGTLTPDKASTTYDYSATPYTFFTLANDGSISGNSRTKLIIKGDIYNSALSTATKVGTYYYPIIINHVMSGTTTDGSTAYSANGTDGQIAPNSYYKLSATIKSKGVTDPTQELTSAAISLTITVTPWPTAYTQNVVFD